LASVAPTVELFVVFRVLTCLGVGGLLPTAVALASEFAAPERRSRTLGLVLTGAPCGMVVAALVSSLVVPSHGFRPVYAAAGSVLVLVPLLLRFLPESPAYLAVRGATERAAAVRSTYGLPALPAGDAAVRSPLSAILRDGNLVPTLLIWGTKFFGLLTVFGITTWLPQVMAKSGYGLGSSIAFLVVYSLGAVVGTVVASSFAERIGPKPLVIVGYLAAAAALLCIAQQPPTVLLVVLVLIAGFGGFGTQNVLNDFIARFYPTANRASGLGWALGVGALGSITGPSFGAAVLATASPLNATATAFAITAVIGAVVISCTPRKAPSLVAQEKEALAGLAPGKADAGQGGR
jgi:AAHS family benzoate transporter-like MFS transporter